MEGEILWIFLEAYPYTARKFFAYSEGVYPSLKTTALENCFCDKYSKAYFHIIYNKKSAAT